MSPSRFTADMHPVLVQLCRTIVYSREFAAWLNENKVASIKGSKSKHRYVSSQFQACSKAIASLSTKLRLTPQARYYVDQEKTHRGAVDATRRGPRPWEVPAG